MKIKSFVKRRLKARRTLTALRILRITTRAAIMRRRRRRMRPILTTVSWMPCLMICLGRWVRPDLHQGEFLQSHRDHRDQGGQGGQLPQLSLGLRGEDFIIASWEVNIKILIQ